MAQHTDRRRRNKPLLFLPTHQNECCDIMQTQSFLHTKRLLKFQL